MSAPYTIQSSRKLKHALSANNFLHRIKVQEVLCEYIEKQPKANVIEPAQSEWTSSIILIPQRNGTVCFCADYCLLNMATIQDIYALPRIDDCIDSFWKAQVFTTMEVRERYWQVSIKDEDKKKTLFTFHLGTYHHPRIQFDLRNASSTSQHTLDIIFAEVLLKTCLIFIDEVVMFS